VVLNRDMVSQLATIITDSLSNSITYQRLSTMSFFKEQKTQSGTEGWFKWEAIHALRQAKYVVDLNDVIKNDCDLIVNNIKIELKSTRKNDVRRLITAIREKHPRADLYMMLCGNLNATSDKLHRKLSNVEYIIQPFPIKDNGWGIVAVNRTH